MSKIDELIELGVPKKVKKKNYGIGYCPTCKKQVGKVINRIQIKYPKCPCGQTLDWSDENE